jgi:glycosyltransferase involved in cell wall biosynthesis
VNPLASRPLTPFSSVTETVVRRTANGPATLLWPARLVDLDGIDALHAPFNLLGRGVRCATVVTVHDLIWLLTPGAAEEPSLALPLQALFYRDGIQRALRRATRLVAISRATADAIALVAPEARPRLRVIPHGVSARFRPAEDPERAREEAARLLGARDPYFLVVGQNAPYKNHERILEAFAAAQSSPRARLVFVQRLYPVGRLARKARDLGIQERVIWRSGLTEGEVVTLLQAALALVQFSRYEGFGMPAAEAMACGAPVVASDIPALVEVLGGAGLAVPLDVRELAAALRRIAEEPSLRAELRARGLERAGALSWDRSAEAHLDVYREAAAAGGR